MEMLIGILQSIKTYVTPDTYAYLIFRCLCQELQ